jgi:peptidoglycan/LPS O-acetylase OafA/YrhL
MGLIRLFLACVVMLGHLGGLYLPARGINVNSWIAYLSLGLNSGYAVVYFYIISGFLMSYTIAHNHGSGREGTLEYYKSRFIRIFSMYWPMFIVGCLVQPPASRSIAAILTGPFLIGADWYVSFRSYPTPDFSNLPIGLEQAWSLGAEMTFYAFAPLVTRFMSLSLLIFAASAACRAYFVKAYGFHVIWSYTFFPSTAMFFIAGHLVRLFGERMKAPRTVGLSMLAGSFLISILGVPSERWDNLAFCASISLFTLAIPTIFAMTKNSRWSAALGDLSYPMYLTHGLTLWAIFTAFPVMTKVICKDYGLPPGVSAVAASLAICLLSSALAHFTLEKPTAALLRHAKCYAEGLGLFRPRA